MSNVKSKAFSFVKQPMFYVPIAVSIFSVNAMWALFQLGFGWRDVVWPVEVFSVSVLGSSIFVLVMGLLAFLSLRNVVSKSRLQRAIVVFQMCAVTLVQAVTVYISSAGLAAVASLTDRPAQARRYWTEVASLSIFFPGATANFLSKEAMLIGNRNEVTPYLNSLICKCVKEAYDRGEAPITQEVLADAAQYYADNGNSKEAERLFRRADSMAQYSSGAPRLQPGETIVTERHIRFLIAGSISPEIRNLSCVADLRPQYENGLDVSSLDVAIISDRDYLRLEQAHQKTTIAQVVQ